jgi:hypothetical protein
VKRAHEQRTSTREAYVQSPLLGLGIRLADLRDIVAATEDYDEHSVVVLEKKRVTITETRRSHWLEVGR